jgi:UDP-N-acetylglucosamine diphosphorylase/glucosamine-1-phosphate N-acetyltransferase
MQLVIFEDSAYRHFLPLSYTRPVCGLRCGITMLWEKIVAAYGVPKPVLHVRPFMAAAQADEHRTVAVNQFDGESALLVNGRLLASTRLAKAIPLAGNDVAYMHGSAVVAARVSGKRWKDIRGLMAAGPLPDGWVHALPCCDTEEIVLDYPWDLVHHNTSQIKADFEHLRAGGVIAGQVHRAAILEGREQIHIAEGAEVQPAAVLLATDGPIYIGPKAKIMAGAVIQGPVAIGARSAVKMQAKIYEGTTLGPYCKVGGEVEESIFQGYSNKQHDGFLGHAYLGEWINLGADTNNSDLKNTYGSVKVVVDGKSIDSGSLFVGATIGDHSKCGINTMLNTGTVIGVGCNVFGADFPPKDVPCFCWGGARGFIEHELGKFLATAERVMRRRDRELTSAITTMLTEVYRQTSGRRAHTLAGRKAAGVLSSV